MSDIKSVMAGLTGQPVQNGINAADFLKGAAPATGIGTLTTTQVQGLMAQTAASAKQAADAVTASGIGKYAMSPQQLEQLGFLKPGTVATYLKDNTNVQSVLSSPAVWTGKDGVGSLGSFLTNPDKQAQALQAGLTNSYANLSKAGLLNNVTNPTDIASLMQVANKFGVQNASLFAQGKAPSALINEMNTLAKSAQFSVNFTDTKLPAGLKGQIPGQSVERQFDRTQVDNAAKSILGNEKIPTPDYKTNPRDKVKAQQQAIDDVERAKANYEKVLAANNNNRSAPAVETAWAEYKAANERLQKL